MKLLLATLCMFLLTACEPTARDISQEYKMPPGLEGCKVFRISEGGVGSGITVVRCPNSATSVAERVGKATQFSSVVE